MDGECAFCGRAEGAACQVFCDDCQAEHEACATCADEVTEDEVGCRPVASSVAYT